MPTILTPMGEGFDPLSLAAIAITLTALLVLSAVHPLSLLAARVAENLPLPLIAKRSAAEVHGVDGSSSASLGAGLLFQGSVLAPGYILFTMALWSAYNGTSFHLFEWLGARGEHGPDLRLTVLVLILVSLAAGAADSLKPFWSKLSGIRLASGINIAATVLLGIGFFQSGFAIDWLPGVLFAGFFFRALAKIAAHGILLFGPAGLAWTGIMLLAWCLANLAAALLGPVIKAAKRVVERPRCSGSLVGTERALALATGKARVPACHSIDALPGMITPR